MLALRQVFSPTTSVFPLSLPFHQRSLLILIYTLLLAEGQTGESWVFSTKIALSVIRYCCVQNYFNFVLKFSFHFNIQNTDCWHVNCCSALCILSILFVPCQALCSGYFNDLQIPSIPLRIIRRSHEPATAPHSVQVLVYLHDTLKFIHIPLKANRPFSSPNFRISLGVRTPFSFSGYWWLFFLRLNRPEL
jgi:hypothetical protein